MNGIFYLSSGEIVHANSYRCRLNRSRLSNTPLILAALKSESITHIRIKKIYNAMYD